jgi:hypothetical protein
MELNPWVEIFASVICVMQMQFISIVLYRPVARQVNNETTVVAMHRRGNHASTTIELLLETVLCNPLLGSCNSWTNNGNEGCFYVFRAEELS